MLDPVSARRYDSPTTLDSKHEPRVRTSETPTPETEPTVPNTQAAEKYYRASQRRRMRNKPVRTHARTTVRDALAAIDANADQSDWSDADAAVAAAVSALDRAAQKGVMHASSAARRKSRLLRRYHTVRTPERTPRPHTPPPIPVAISS